MNPTECKYCGCDKFNADSVSMTRFRCGSTYWPRDEAWQISNGCAHKCAVQLVELRERVQRAVEVLEKGKRFVDYTVSEDALEILRGNSPADDRSLANRLLPDLAMILSGIGEGRNKCMPWLNVCRELGLTLKDLTDEIKKQGKTNGKAD